MILIAWCLGVIWLAVSTVVASMLGISLWIHVGGLREHMFLIIEVVLSLLEAILLMALAAWCLREREIINRTTKVGCCDNRYSVARLNLWSLVLVELQV